MESKVTCVLIKILGEKGMARLFSLGACIILLVCLTGVGCNAKENYDYHNADVDASVDVNASADVEIDLTCDEVEVKIYRLDYVQEYNRHILVYSAEIISQSNISEETIPLMKEHNNIVIDGIWYEDNRICIDLNETERVQMDRGSTAGVMTRELLLYTFSSYPDVKEIEILINGERGQYGNHFNFEDVFDAKLDDPTGRFY